MLGDAKLAQAMAADLYTRGVHVAPFFFPVVPKGQARIRTQMNAALTRHDLDFALDAFTKAGKATGVLLNDQRNEGPGQVQTRARPLDGNPARARDRPR